MTTTLEIDGIAVTLDADLPFAQASIGFGTDKPGMRPLLVDVYAPASPAAPGASRPALILSHGGAYHRGAKDEELFEQDGWRSTAMAEYCQRFAARGYVCFSVGYRLTQQLPAPQAQPIKRDRERVSRGRIDFVREILGLPPATDQELLNGVEAAFADVAAAFDFVAANAARWAIDTSRIAMGGFSAGAFASIYAAFALGRPAAAIVSISGGMDGPDVDHYVHGTRGQPPLLLFSSQFDLPGIGDRTLALANGAERAGLPLRRYYVPEAPHFYPYGAPVELQQATLAGGASRCTVESAIASFLDDAMPVPAVDTGMLQVFAQAWSDHDIDTLMSFMTDDCVFHSGAGPDASGTRFVGRDAVRAGFAKAWADYPDAQWTRGRHFVAGSRGVSEWTFVGTSALDGSRLQVDGCDLFTFRGNKIRVKDSWRKRRT